MQYEPIAVITDSSSDLPAEYVADQEHLYILPLQLIYPEKTYRDGVEISPEDVYARMDRDEVPTTTLPSPDDVTNVFEDLKRKGIQKAVFVMMSSGLSGTYNMVRLMCEHHTEVKTLVYDTRILSMGLGYMVMSTIDMVRQGVKLEALHDRLESLRENVDGFFYLPTLEYLSRGGRIGLVAGTVGKLLNIRPIIGINREGKYYTRSACIGAKKILKQAIKITSEIVGDHRFDLTVMSGNAMGEAQNLLDELKKLPGVISSQLCRLGPALAVHTGPGMLAVLVRAH